MRKSRSRSANRRSGTTASIAATARSEDPAEVVVNETLGETGIHCRPREHLGNRIHPVTGVNCEYFLCDHLTGEPANLDPEENAAVSWIEQINLFKFISKDLVFQPIVTALNLEA
jgi:8-oxo-dGTP diphosphatase